MRSLGAVLSGSELEKYIRTSSLVWGPCHIPFERCGRGARECPNDYFRRLKSPEGMEVPGGWMACGSMIQPLDPKSGLEATFGL